MPARTALPDVVSHGLWVIACVQQDIAFWWAHLQRQCSRPARPDLSRSIDSPWRRYEKQHRHNKLLHLLGGTGAVPQWKGIEAGEAIALHQVRRVSCHDAMQYPSHAEPCNNWH